MFLLDSTMTTFVSGLQYSNIYKHDIYDFYDLFSLSSTFFALSLFYCCCIFGINIYICN